MSAKPTARRIAWEILNQFSKSEIRAEEILPSRLQSAGLSQADERLCRELCFGVIKMHKLLDYGLQPFWQKQRQPPAQLLNLLRLGAYQLLLLSKVPPHAAVFETVELAKLQLPPGQVKMANAVLRKIARLGIRSLPERATNKVLHLSIRYSFPEYIVRRWLTRFGEEKCEAMLSAANEAPGLWARVNAIVANRQQVLEELQSQGLEGEPGILPTSLQIRSGKKSPVEMPGWCSGQIYYQDQASQMVGWLVDPQPGQICLDLCSSPGGKATHLAELLQGSGQVWALDQNQRKLQRIEENVKRLCLGNITVALKVAPGFLADRVLVDAPCSGLGTLRRHPELRWRVQEKDHARLGKKQLELLTQAAIHVRPGGHLIYSTCTTEPEENEEVIKAFLSQRPEYSLLSGPGSRNYPDARFWNNDGFFRTFPLFPEFDGMFSARLVKAA